MSDAACESPETADDQIQYVTTDTRFSISAQRGKTHLRPSGTDFGANCHSRDKMLQFLTPTKKKKVI